MAVDDLWYLARKSTSGKRVKSKLHGKGKRYRVRYTDASGKNATKFYDKKGDADAFDLEARTGTAPEVKLDQSEKRVTFGEYAERWRISRAIGQSLEYQDHVLSRLRTHHLPRFGHRPIRAITVTDVMEWLASLLNAGAAQSSIRTLFDNFNTILNAAVADKVISDNPCKAVPIHSILRGVSRAPKWVPTDEQVLDLLDVVPPKYLAAIWLGAGQGERLGEVLGMEAGTRCVDYLNREVHVVQQLRFNKKEYAGFYLAPPKSRSAGTIDLDDQVAIVLAEHLRKFPPVTVSLPDITAGTPDPGKPATRRDVALLFTTDDRKPIADQRWSDMFREWRTAAGWPPEGSFHSLRHYFATTLIVNGTDPTDVQKALRHRTLRITLETYVHWWPKSDRRRSIISAVLAAKRSERGQRATGS